MSVSDGYDQEAGPGPADAPGPRGHGRLLVALIAVGVLSVIVVATGLIGGDHGGAVSDSDPVVALDAALAAGEPVYVLIHSLT